MNEAPAQSYNAVRARDLGKSYGSNWALRGVSIDVSAGEAVAVFGANGAGKSTLIRLLATLTAPSAGTLELMGHDAARHARRARPVLGVLVHQNYLYAELSATENLTLYAQLYGVADPVERARNALASVGLTAVAGRRVRELSRGMQQRLAFARSTIHAPALLLLDEPDSGLDAEGKKSLERLLQDGRRQGQAAVISTHDIELGLALCQRALILARGRAVYAASTEAHSLTQWHALYHSLSALSS